MPTQTSYTREETTPDEGVHVSQTTTKSWSNDSVDNMANNNCTSNVDSSNQGNVNKKYGIDYKIKGSTSAPYYKLSLFQPRDSSHEGLSRRSSVGQGDFKRDERFVEKIVVL